MMTGTDEPRPVVELGSDFEADWPGASALATACILNLAVVSDQALAFGQALVRRHGLPTIAAFNVLTILHGAGGPLPPSVIAERMIVSRPTVTGILGTLEARGLTRRAAHPADRRMALVALTPAGGALVEELRPVLHAAERAWLACLGEAEQRALLGLLARLQANAPAPGSPG
jgi:DNA-binding MarR family transcriptional regulator